MFNNGPISFINVAPGIIDTINGSGILTLNSAAGPAVTLKPGPGITSIVQVNNDLYINGAPSGTDGTNYLTKAQVAASGFATIAELVASGYTTLSEVRTDLHTSGYQRTLTVYPILTDYVVKASDRVLLINASGAPIVLTLPTASAVSGIEFNFKKTDATVNIATVSGTQNIDGALTAVVSGQWSSLKIISDAIQYWTL